MDTNCQHSVTFGVTYNVDGQWIHDDKCIECGGTVKSGPIEDWLDPIIEWISSD